MDEMKYKKSTSVVPEQRGQGSFRQSAQHALRGISYGLYYERNLRRDFWLINLLLVIELVIRPTFGVAALTMFVGFMVMAGELFNTAIERTVDLAADGQILELARIAKDTAAGAVLLIAISTLGIGGYMLHSTYPWHFDLFTRHHWPGVVLNTLALAVLWYLRIHSIRYYQHINSHQSMDKRSTKRD